jgi:hypothetical protein
MIQSDPIYEIIVTSVESFTRTSREDFSADNRKRENVFPRQLIMFFLKNHTDYSLKDIGAIFNRDHATTLHSCKKINDFVDVEKNLRSFVEKTNTEISNFKGVVRKPTKLAIFLDLLMQYATPKEQSEWIKRYKEAN